MVVHILDSEIAEFLFKFKKEKEKKKNTKGNSIV